MVFFPQRERERGRETKREEKRREEKKREEKRGRGEIKTKRTNTETFTNKPLFWFLFSAQWWYLRSPVKIKPSKLELQLP
jgi:hypothetical protein